MAYVLSDGETAALADSAVLLLAAGAACAGALSHRLVAAVAGGEKTVLVAACCTASPGAAGRSSGSLAWVLPELAGEEEGRRRKEGEEKMSRIMFRVRSLDNLE